MLSFSVTARLGAIVTLILFSAFAFFPVLPFAVFGVEMTPEAMLIGRRMSALFLGIGVMLALSHGAENSPLRRSISAGLSVSMAALALFGLWDFVHGSAGLGIWAAILAETFFAAAFAFHARSAPAP